jgi:hypothetical protein
LALPADLLSGIDLAQVVGALSQGLAAMRTAPFPAGATAITHTESLTCEIGAGGSGMIRFEARATRTIASVAPADEMVQPPEIGQHSSGSIGGDMASVSLPGNRPPSLRAEELVNSIRRALGEYDLTSARQQGGELETLVTTAQKGDLPPEILFECYQTLCRVELAMVPQDDKASPMHRARARDFLERAKNVHRT